MSDQLTHIELLDRIVAPIQAQLNLINEKLDHVARIGERVNAQERKNEQLEKRVGKIEDNEIETAKELAYVRGRNAVIVWLLGGIGGPIVVALVLAGIASLFGITL